MAYDWTGITGTPGEVNKQGLHNLSGVHASTNLKGNKNGTAMQEDAYYSDMFLERKRLKGDDLVFAGFAESRSIRKGLDTINLRKYQPLKAHTIPLVEGNPPAPDKANGSAILGKTRQYGRYMEFTDLFEVKISDPVIEEYTMELADLANETIDQLAQAALLAEAQIFFPIASGSSTKVGLVDSHETDAKTTIPTIEDLRIIKLSMEVAKVKPVGGYYVVLASPAVIFDLQTSETAIKYMSFGQTNAIIAQDSLPNMFGLTFKRAMSAKTEYVKGTNVSTTVHHTIVLGAKAYSRIEIAGNGGTQFFRKALGSAGTQDPLNQRQTMGWKINALGFKVTDPDAVVDYMSIPSQSEMIVDDFDYVSTQADEIGITLEMAQKASDLDVKLTASGTAEASFAKPADEAALKLLHAKDLETTGLEVKTAGQFADVSNNVEATKQGADNDLARGAKVRATISKTETKK